MANIAAMKNRLTKFASAAAILASAASLPANAEVRKQDKNGFWITHIAEVKASPDDIWKRLVQPKNWWNKEHSWSGSVEGFYIDAQAGGCFCELIKEKVDKGNPKLAGSVEHMRVIFVQPGKVLRMSGALGPLQSEAVTGTLTVAIAPVKDKDGMTAVSFNYIVGGYMRFEAAKMATAVDAVIGEQFRGLVKPFSSGKPDAIKDGVWELDIGGITDGKKTDGDEDSKPDSADKKKEEKEKGR
ncbi:MAG: hypothetical protein V3V15_10910 [Sphingorhabdus sp.]